MRVLFIAGAYHPYYSANGLCLKRVVDACVSRGIDATCLVNAAKGVPFDSSLDGARVVRVKPRLFIRWQQYANAKTDSVIVKHADKAARLANRAKMLMMSRRWPQVSPSYTKRFFEAADRLHKEKPFDIVVAVYTPIDALLAGMRLKRANPEIVFVPYYLDALAGGWGPALWSREKTEERTRTYEKAIDASANAIVSMRETEQYHQANPLEPDIQAKRIYLGVPMMTTVVGGHSGQGNSKNPYVLFAGGIPYPRRDPKPLLDLMSEVCVQSGLDFVIAGECSDPTVLDPYIAKSGGRIKYLGWQEKDTIEELEANAFALANIGSTNPNTIPCKIFEYMAHLKPVISTYRIDDEPSVPYLSEYGHAIFVDERESGSSQVASVVSFLDNYRLKSIPDDTCEGKFYRNTPAALVDLLEGLYRKGHDA